MGETTKFCRVAVSDLIPYINNAKIHTEDQITRIASSIREFGFLNPVLIDAKKNVIAGHGRIMAAKKLGMDEVPCVYVEGLTDAQRKAYILADNRLSELGEWDMELVMGELAELDELGFDTELTGFDFQVEPEITDDEDDVPEPPTEPKAKLGDLYQLGRHRLICGDSTDVNVIDRLMGGKKADVTFTSPPYNGDNGLPDGDVFAGRKSKRLYGDGYKDSLASSEYVDFCKRALEVCFENTDGFIFWNVNYNAKSRSEYIKQIEDRLDYLIEQIAWVKSSAIPLQGTMRRAWEPVYMFSTNKNSPEYAEVVSNKWEINNTNIQYENHKACFPVQLPAKGIEIIKPKTGIVFEPFGGTGTTLIACEQLNRTCYMCELDPKYIDVIIERWETFTGEKAVLLDE